MNDLIFMSLYLNEDGNLLQFDLGMYFETFWFTGFYINQLNDFY